MTEAFAWLGEIVNWVGKWIPRLTIVTTTEGWVKFVRGSLVKSGGPGLVWHWPLVTELRVIPVARDSINCRAQTITTPSGETILIEAVVIYEIIDIERIVAHTADYVNTIHDVTLGAILSVMEGLTWGDIQALSIRQPRARDTEFNYRLKEEVQRALQPYGVSVLSVMLQNKAKARVIKLVNSQD